MNTIPLNQTESKRLLFCHYLLCGFSFIIILHKLGVLFGLRLAEKFNQTIAYNEWALSCLEHHKPSELCGFLFPLGGMLLYYFVMHAQLHGWVQFKNTPLLNRLNSAFKIVVYAIMLAFANVGALILGRNEHLLFTSAVLWAVIFSYPFWGTGVKRIINYVAIGALVLLVIQLWWIFTPYIKLSPPLLSNDFMDIPEQTQMGTRLIDNTQFINQHALGGIAKYDPRLLDKQLPLKQEKDYVSLDLNKELKHFLDKQKETYFYDTTYQRLFITKLLSSEEIEKICYQTTDLQCAQIKKQQQLNELKAQHEYSTDELAFIKKNQYEMYNQAIAGHYFHHHHAFLGPLNASTLGKSSEQVLFLYGWLNTAIVAKLLNLWGGISFANYLKVSYLFYPIYYSLIALFAFIMFRNIWITLGIFALSISSLFLIGFEAIHIAPGFNPFRHFFDIFVLMSLFGYLFATKNNKFWLLCAYIFSFIAFLADKEFGLFITVACGATYIYYAFENKKITRFEAILLFLGAIAIIATLAFFPGGKNPTSLYSFTGVSVPETKLTTIRNSLYLFSLLYLALLFHPWQDKRWKYLSLYLFIYAQLALVYYMWYSERGHFLVFLPIWVFLATLLLKELFSFTYFRHVKNEAVLLISIAISAIYFPAALSYFQDQTNYFRIFKDHTLYTWNMPTAQFISTMDPQPFINSIALINKYSAANGIYIISKYDNFLPFLARKYSEMPFLQLDLSLVSDKEMQTAKEAILKNKPQYIFVDSDIERSRLGEIFNSHDPITKKLGTHALSRGRAMVLENLSQFFVLIKTDYKLIEQGELISVYQYKS